MLVWLANQVTTSPRRLIICVMLAALVALGGLKNTHFVSDFDSTLPNRSVLTRQILTNHDRFGGRNTLAFLISGGTTEARTKASCALTEGLIKTRGVAQGQVYGAGSDSLKMLQSDAQGMFVQGLSSVCERPGGLNREQARNLGPQAPIVMAPNGDLIVTADLSISSGEFGPLMQKFDALIGGIQYHGVQIAYSGQPAFLAQNDIFSKRIAYFFPVIMFLVLLLHWEALRSVQAVVVPIFTGLTATLIGLGIYGWLKLSLDTYTVLAPILILAVGAGHSVQLLKRYMEEVRLRTPLTLQVSAAANADAVRTTLLAMAPVLILAVIGAASCLFALLLLDVAALARFGFLAGVGIIAALVLELTVVPAIRMLLRRPTMRANYGELSSRWQRGLRYVCNAALAWPVNRVLMILAALAILLVAGLAQVRTSHSMAVYTAADVPVQKTLARLEAAGVGPYSLDVVFDTGRENGAFDPRATQALLQLSAVLEQDRNVRALLSAPATIGFVRCRFSGDPGCSPKSTGSAEEAQQTWTVLLGSAHGSGFMDETARYLRLRAFVRTDETATTAKLIDTITAFGKAHKLPVTVGGSAVTAKALADGIVRVSLEKAALLAGIVFAMGGLVFRSFKMALIFAIPALATIAANFAYLGWSGTTLNVATAAVATIAVGVGLDYLIYLSFRIREALKAGHDYDAAIRIGHASAGGAAVCVATAVAVGYAVLIVSPGYLVHHWIAVLVPTTMLMSLFGALFIFPFLLRLFRPSLLKMATNASGGSPSPLAVLAAGEA
jgi:uncharacterized protein